MKKALETLLCLTMITMMSCLSFSGINIPVVATAGKHHVKITTVTTKAQPTISDEYTHAASFYLGLVKASCAIIRVKVQSSSEKAFVEYSSNKVVRREYRRLLTVMPTEIYRREAKCSDIRVGIPLNILSESCSYSFFEEAIPMDVKGEYILFLTPTQNSGLFEYAKYGKYSVFNPAWSTVSIKDKVCSFSMSNKELLMGIDDAEAVRVNYGKYSSTIIKSRGLQDRLSDIIRGCLNTFGEHANPDIDEGLNWLSSGKTASVDVADDHFTSVSDIGRVLDFLSSIKANQVNGKNTIAMIPTGGIPLTVKINYKYGSRIKQEYITLHGADCLIDSAYDTFNNLVFSRFYTYSSSENYIELKKLCDDIISNKINTKPLQLDKMDADDIEFATVSCLSIMSRKIKDRAEIKAVVALLKSINPIETDTTDSFITSKKIIIDYKAGHDLGRQILYFKDRSMQYKGYDSRGKLITTGFYRIDRDIAKQIDDFVRKS